MRILVLTEDSSQTALGTVQALLRHLLIQVEPSADFLRINFDPIPESLASDVLAGNVWKSAKKTATAGIVDLVQRIARQLVLDDGFVVHHVDGDRIWAERATSENVSRYRDVIERRVREQVKVWTTKKMRGSEVDARMGRLLLMVPFWSIEAWLFQNTVKAELLCQDATHECRNRLKDWRDDRSRLDEERTPKELLCFGSKHNLELAIDHFPADPVREAEKSYAAAVNTLAGCQYLVELLKQSSKAPSP